MRYGDIINGVVLLKAMLSVVRTLHLQNMYLQDV